VSEPTISIIQSRTIDAREEAFEAAIRALAKYKFWMFGYHAACWVKYNRLLKGTPWHNGSPFGRFVELARIEIGELPDAKPHEIHKAKHLSAQWGESMFDMDYEEAEMVSGEKFHPLPRVGDEPNATGVVTPDEPPPTDPAQVPDKNSSFLPWDEWERAVLDCLIDDLEITNSDAQGIVEGRGKMANQLWHADYTPQQAATAIDIDSRVAACFHRQAIISGNQSIQSDTVNTNENRRQNK